MQHDGAGVAHEVRIGFRQQLDVVAGRQQAIDEIAVEAGFEPLVCMGRAPGAAEQPARGVDRLVEWLPVGDVAGE